MNELRKHIDNQLKSSRGKNVCIPPEQAKLEFLDHTDYLIKNLESIKPQQIEELISYTTDKAIEEFCRLNQYYVFDHGAKHELKQIYRTLFQKLSSNPDDLEYIAAEHYGNLRSFLLRTNPLAQQYVNGNVKIEAVACSEYPATMQLSLLNINPDELMEPVLDIGCGKEARLLKYLQKAGLKVFGIDRFVDGHENCLRRDWFEVHLPPASFGTIISNLGFSNQFRHHHLLNDGRYIRYAQKYMEILASLKEGGCFFYAPGLPFIECYLDSNEYRVEEYEIENTDYTAIKITRI